MVKFDKDFIFGAATASYQIEGAWNEDGKGLSIWDTFTRKPGNISDGTSGDSACDHYNLYENDVEKMAEMGLQAYRFSVSWPRILPGGKGKLNSRGIDFYSRLIDKLLEKNIEPFITLYHWDLPEDLMAHGGWQSREIASYFADYTAQVVSSFKDRVNSWITLNEPNVVWSLGHLTGEHAPGLKGIENAATALHPILLAHGKALQVIRDLHPAAKAGMSVAMSPAYPVTEKDREAAELYLDFWIRSFTDPMFKGKYPESVLSQMPDVKESIMLGDMDIISKPVDFLGINQYSRAVIKSSDASHHGFEGVAPDYPGVKFTEMGWEVFPEGMNRILHWTKDNYGNVPVYITENGCAFPDTVQEGRIHDEDRIAYYREYITQVKKAMDEGVDVRGYFAWSLMDNFEWAFGESKRFGLWYTDYSTKERIWKDSAYWYQDLCKKRSI